MSHFAAVLFGVAPFGFGLFRVWSTGTDYQTLWMAGVASVFAAGVLAAAIGRRRSRKAVFVQSMVIVVVATLLAAGTDFLLGATTGPGVWMVATVFGVCLAVSSVFVAFSRPSAH
jgi:hypothetical protein